MQTYYELLGVPEDASTAEIQESYRERLKETHPDVSDDADASDRTRQLIEAKEVLVDETERARYDRLGHERFVAQESHPNASGDGPATSARSSSGTAASESTRQDPTDERSRSGTDRAAEPGTGTDRAAGSGTGTDRAAGGSEGSGWTEESRQTWDDYGGGDAGFGTGADQRAPRDSWHDAADRSESDGSSGTWRAWDTNVSYTVYDDAGVQRSRLFPTSQSLVLLGVTFLFYPVLLVATLFRPFPLVVNAIVGACLLAVVAYLQSIPVVGLLVFGAWSVLTPLVFVGLGIPLFSLLGVAALAATVLPFGLSLLTWTFLRG